MTRSVLLAVAFSLSLLDLAWAQDQGPTVAIDGAGTTLRGAVLRVPLTGPALPSVVVELRDGQGQVAAFGQVFEQDGSNHLAILIGHGDGEKLDLRARPVGPSDRLMGHGLRIEEQEQDVRFLIGEELLTVYRNDAGFKPYFWPLIGPTGEALTRAWPMARVEDEDRDHNHQRSFWFSHGEVNGIDFWASDALNSPNPKFGTIRETGRAIVCRGPLVAILRTTNDWCGPDGKTICRDVRTFRAYATGPNRRVLDFEITIEAAGAPVTFGDTKEGSFGVRVASTMDVNAKQGGKITNAEGIIDGDAWGKPSPWVDYTGPVGGRMVGIAILNHPDSFRYPTTWHVRDYGLFAANPFGYHDFGVAKPGEHTLDPGDSITLKYRVILHVGTTSEADIAGAFAGYATPPTVRVEAQ